MDEQNTPRPELTRRVVLRGAALSGVALPLLVACGSSSDTAGSGGASAGSGSATSSAPGASGTASAGGGTTVPVSDVPVGGGTILADAKVVVTQPTKGDYKAFSAVCTHQGCTVQKISEGRINCPCHGSAFSIEDGSVVNGPATRSLEGLTATVEGDSITVS